MADNIALWQLWSNSLLGIFPDGLPPSTSSQQTDVPSPENRYTSVISNQSLHPASFISGPSDSQSVEFTSAELEHETTRLVVSLL